MVRALHRRRVMERETAPNSVAEHVSPQRAARETKHFDSSAIRFVDAAQAAAEPQLSGRADLLTSSSTYQPARAQLPPGASAYTTDLYRQFARLQKQLAGSPDMTCLKLRDVFLMGKL